MIWYVIVSRTGYPLLIYPDKQKAEEIARLNNELVVSVQVIKGI